VKRFLQTCSRTAVRAAVGLAIVGIASTAACRRQAPPAAPLRIAAAADLNAAMPELLAAFQAKTGIRASVSFGSSGNFYSQLLNQAPFDLFFSADVEYPKQLAARGLTLPDSAFTYAFGRLVLWVRSSSPLDLTRDGLHTLTADSIAHIALANPEHAPYGRAAVAALKAANLYDRVQPKLVYGESVAQTMQFVQSGAADAGFVALALAMAPNAKDTGRWIDVPQSLYPPLEQGGAILGWTSNADAARALRAFVIGADGQALLARYGFAPPER
jgi:molybdate transport system substrate-binding protein